MFFGCIIARRGLGLGRRDLVIDHGKGRCLSSCAGVWITCLLIEA